MLCFKDYFSLFDKMSKAEIEKNSEDKLDAIDIELLRLLQENCKQTTKELASKVHLSQTPVFERIRQMETSGYIEGYSARLNRRKLNRGLCVFCSIRLKKHSREYIIHFKDAIMHVPEIVECYNISGDYDFMLKIIVESMSHYQDFVQNKLGVIESVGSLHSLFVIDEVKQAQSVLL